MSRTYAAHSIAVADFERLYRDTAPELFAYLRRRGAVDPEDLVAETYAIAWRRRSDLPAPMLRRAWLYGTARRLLLAHARHQGREEEALGRLARADQVASPASGRGLEEAVAAALSRLSSDDRELIMLVEWEQLTAAEVAIAFGIRPGTARVRLHRARQALAADPDMQALVSAQPLPASGTTAGRNT